MNNYVFTMALCATVAVSGCARPSPRQTLADGVYRMTADIKKPGIQRNYGGASDCRVTIQGTSIRIEPQESDSAVWYEGTIKDQQVKISLRNKTPDPMLEEYHFTESWTGRITANDTVEGQMTIHAGTNLYMSGTWSLKKKSK